MIKPVLIVGQQVQSSELRVLSVGVAAPYSALVTQDSVPAFRRSVPSTQHSKGFTLIELIIVICIVVILAGLFLVRVPFYQEQAEKAAMQQVEGAIQSALILRYGAMMTRGSANETEISRLANDNPMNWLQQKPKNYAGEFFAPSPGVVAPGQWVFDLQSRELVYIVDRGDNFTPGKDGNKWIRFRVRLNYEPMLGRPKAGKELVGTLFAPAEPYHWID